MGRVIDLKTRKDITEPPTQANRLVAAVNARPNMKYARDELCVALVRISTGLTEVIRNQAVLPPGDHGVIVATNILREIDIAIAKLGAKS